MHISNTNNNLELQSVDANKDKRHCFLYVEKDGKL